MRGLLRSAAFEALAATAAFPTTRTRPEAVRGLLAALRPVHAGIPLLRLGPDGDGGYLVPDDLEGIGACFSPGVDRESGFELACARRGMEVFMADASVDGPAAEHPGFHFTKTWLGAVSEPGSITLEDWVAHSGTAAETDLLLQIDIEGAEYETLLAAPEPLLRRFRVIVGEFHHLNQLWNAPYFGIVSRVFAKLLRTHRVVHLHPNNRFPPFEHGGLEIPPLLEFTFLRRDRGDAPVPVTAFPHPLDRDNTSRPPYALPACWYRDEL